MKFVFLGYIEPGKFENMPENDRNSMMDRCFTYDDVLRKDGHSPEAKRFSPRTAPRRCASRSEK